MENEIASRKKHFGAYFEEVSGKLKAAAFCECEYPESKQHQPPLLGVGLMLDLTSRSVAAVKVTAIAGCAVPGKCG